jgi:GNAT superfamily N-acetyltransferase
MAATELRIRRASANDRATVLELLSEHLPDTQVERRYEWLYERNPHGPAVTFLAFDPVTDDPIALTSLFPRRVLVDGSVRVGSIGGDGYVRPAFRRRGVATALHKACLEEMGNDVEFMYGAPVPNNLKALVRAGSKVVTHLLRYARPWPLHRVIRSITGLTSKSPAKLVAVDGKDPRVRSIWERAQASAQVMPIRDDEHYAWRFSTAPSQAQRAFVVEERGAPVAVCALEAQGDRVGIVDFFAPRDRMTQALWATANACEGKTVMMLVNDGGPATHALLATGFLPRERKAFQVLVPEAHPAAGTLFDARRWYYTWGDGDIDRVL